MLETVAVLALLAVLGFIIRDWLCWRRMVRAWRAEDAIFRARFDAWRRGEVD